MDVIMATFKSDRSQLKGIASVICTAPGNSGRSLRQDCGILTWVRKIIMWHFSITNEEVSLVPALSLSRTRCVVRITRVTITTRVWHPSGVSVVVSVPVPVTALFQVGSVCIPACPQQSHWSALLSDREGSWLFRPHTTWHNLFLSYMTLIVLMGLI